MRAPIAAGLENGTLAEGKSAVVTGCRPAAMRSGARKVVLVCHVFPPEPAPGGIMVAELAEHLARIGHEVTVITGWPNHPGGVLYHGWTRKRRQVLNDSRGFRVMRCNHSVHPRSRVGWRLWYYLTFAVSAALGLLRVRRPDVVFSLSTPLFGSPAAWIVSRLKRARFVYAIFDLHPEAALNAGQMRRGIVYRMLRAVDTVLCRRSDSILTLTEGIRMEIMARGIDPGRVHVAPLWLDGDRIRPSERDNEWRRGCGLAPGTFVALFAGTIGYASGAEVLLDVAERLSRRQDIVMLCVGEGPVKDRMEKAAAERRITNLRFLPFQPEERLNDVQAAADAGLVTLLPQAGRTSMPSKVLAYMAAGRAVVASVSEDCETAILVRANECGIVVPCQDPSSLAEAIEALADDRSRCLELGNRGREAYERCFSRDAGVKRYEALILGGGAREVRTGSALPGSGPRSYADTGPEDRPD